MPEVPFGPAPSQQDYFTPPAKPEEEPRTDLGFATTDPTGGQLFAGMRLYNPVFNFLDYATAPRFKPNADYDLVKDLKDNDLWNDHRYEFVGVQSRDEFVWTANKLRGEQRDRETHAAAGIPGIATGMAAGLFSPTSFCR